MLWLKSDQFPSVLFLLLISVFSLLWLCGASLRLMKRSRSPQDSDMTDYEVDEAAPSSSSPPPPPVREDGFQYDVFLSFRGADTRKGFTSHLYQALQDKDILTFIDSKKLEKGQKVKELFGYIERSKIFVPIFSQGYANSEWCLKEITKMVECKRLIIPVFFDVEPREVRHQSGPFAPAFTRYSENDITNKEEVTQWRNALMEAGEVSGFVLAGTNGDEATEIKDIVTRILTEVNRAPLCIGATHPIGLDSRLAELVEVLELEAHNDDVKMVGIHGMGGIGKTTLARAVYNQLFPRFDACSFISDVREKAKQSKLVSLQEQLLRDVLKDENVKVNDTAHGTSMIMCRMQHKKVLLVLDDVDSKSQLEALVGSVDRFRPGSRIIITTRDMQVLIEPPTLRVKNVYKMKVLDSAQSLQLFSWHAFGTKEPPAQFAKLSQEVAATAAGLPLALQIFGRHFLCLNTNKQREAMLKKLKKIPDEGIHERLKISFDALNKEEKIVFLDIVCFFIGEQSSYATFIWEERDLFPELTIQVLMHKCLVNINKGTGEFEMHDSIRDMGRIIVEVENPSDPGMRSRLWKKDDILDVLQNKRGTEKIEAIDVSCLWPDSGDVDAYTVDVDAESFAGMSQLRMLWLRNVELRGEYGHFPKTLKWLKWNSRDLDSLPTTLPHENIVVLDLSWSSITQVWKNHGFRETKVFGQLKALNLSECMDLTVCPDFKCMPYIEKLDFTDCEKLTELHPSIGHLKSLTRLNLWGCKSLKELPEGVWQLTSLEELDLSYCSQITALPSLLMDSKWSKQLLLGKLKEMNLRYCNNLTICPDFTCMPYIEKLDFNWCKKLTELHPSIAHLKSLRYLPMSGCESLKKLSQGVWQLTSLEELDLSFCRNLTISPDFTSMPYIEKLNFRDCGELTELHPSIGHLKSLTDLNLSWCTSLKELPEGVWQLTSLIELDLSYCSQIITLPSQLGNSGQLKQLFLDGTSITALPESMRQLKQLNRLSLNKCNLLKEIPEWIHSWISLEVLEAAECLCLASLPNAVGNLRSLRNLDLSGTAIKQLPCSFTSLEKLDCLLVTSCKRLKFLPQLPPSLTILDAKCCCELEVIADVSNAEKLWFMNLRSCKNLVDVVGIEQLRHLKALKLEGCISLSDSLKARVEVIKHHLGIEQLTHVKFQSLVEEAASPYLEASTSRQMHQPNHQMHQPTHKWTFGTGRSGWVKSARCRGSKSKQHATRYFRGPTPASM